ncbi:Aristolochene synthase in complex with 12,13 Difluorofarnesyl diphosphate [Ustulina deusta]|nr:Aristolochene synthase in complex with 12,13 Difluorofarnesyl diphosphate [Ustulina deusta]KAI3328820.1 Aristolochene synthase in complex with 12,13 Difluorofarnesyl diphosphate [Ustulina deusta]
MPFAERFNRLQIPATAFTVRTHPLTDTVADAVNQFFLDTWPFPGEKERKKFLGADFPRFVCYYFPNALGDRLRLVCEVVTHLFIVDDIIEAMSLKDGRAFNDKLIALACGDVLPNRNSPPEWIMYDVWQGMRKCDKELADAMLQPCFDFMNSQTDPRRLTKMNLEQYLEYRLEDVGKEFLSALICFTQSIRLTKEEWVLVDPVDKNSARHISVINDIWSYDKEVRAAATLKQEGSTMLNAVDILADEASMPAESAKRVLYQLCREWEIVHETLVAEILDKHDSRQLRAYFKETEYQMSGNEIWSRLTLRYSQIH